MHVPSFMAPEMAETFERFIGSGWLTRLDMQGQMLSAGPGYRGNMLDAEDLWAILEDPEAEAELRTAAARIHIIERV